MVMYRLNKCILNCFEEILIGTKIAVVERQPKLGTRDLKNEINNVELDRSLIKWNEFLHTLNKDITPLPRQKYVWSNIPNKSNRIKNHIILKLELADEVF